MKIHLKPPTESHCGSNSITSTWIKVNVPTLLSAIHSKPEAGLFWCCSAGRRARPVRRHLGRSEYKGQLVSDH